MFKVNNKDEKEASYNDQNSYFLTGSFSSKNDKNIPIELRKQMTHPSIFTSIVPELLRDRLKHAMYF